MLRRRTFLLAPAALVFIPAGSPATPSPSAPTPVPTPGAFYKIKAGDCLLVLASRAYNTRIGTADNLEAARLINDEPQNAEFRRIVARERALFPDGRISFLRRFGATGREFAAPFIPIWTARLN